MSSKDNSASLQKKKNQIKWLSDDFNRKVNEAAVEEALMDQKFNRKKNSDSNNNNNNNSKKSKSKGKRYNSSKKKGKPVRVGRKGESDPFGAFRDIAKYTSATSLNLDLELGPVYYISTNTTYAIMQGVVLPFSEYIFYLMDPESAAQIGSVIGTLVDDLNRAMADQISEFETMPKFWWDLRNAVRPKRSKNLNLAFVVTNTSFAALSYSQYGVTYGYATKAVVSGANTVTNMTEIAAGSITVDYDAAGKVYARLKKMFNFVEDPCKGKECKFDCAAFSYQYATSTNTSAIGGMQAGQATWLTTYLAVTLGPVRKRWLCALPLNASTSPTQLPVLNGVHISDWNTELGHQILCDRMRAGKDHRRAKPVVTVVDLSQLITCGLTAIWKAAALAGATLSVSCEEHAANLQAAAISWFGPWSIVAPKVGYNDASGSKSDLYTATYGTKLTCDYANRAFPLLYVCNLASYWVERVGGRVYYPVLGMRSGVQPMTSTTVGWRTADNGAANWAANASACANNAWSSYPPIGWWRDTSSATTSAAVDMEIIAQYCPIANFPKTCLSINLAPVIYNMPTASITYYACRSRLTTEMKSRIQDFVTPVAITQTWQSASPIVQHLGMREFQVTENNWSVLNNSGGNQVCLKANQFMNLSVNKSPNDLNSNVTTYMRELNLAERAIHQSHSELKTTGGANAGYGYMDSVTGLTFGFIQDTVWDVAKQLAIGGTIMGAQYAMGRARGQN
jgi:hypothetical protein